MLRVSVLVASIVVLGLVGCGGDATSEVNVLLVSDFVPGPEVSRVTTELFIGDFNPSSRSAERQERALRFGDAVARGLTVARFRGVANGPYSIKVSVEGPDGDVVASRIVSTAVSASRTYTVHITRECATVVCPGAGSAGDSACLAGRCVDPRCTAEDRTHCPPDVFCNVDENCATESTCGDARCDEGVCVFEAREGGCGETEWCAREEGCAPLEMPDLPSGPDARCGTICRLADAPCLYGYYACTTGSDGAANVVCTSFLTRPVGAPCGEGLVCDETRECVEAPDAGVTGDAAIDGGTGSLDAAVDAGLEPCADGFERVGLVCVDIDECVSLGAGACDGAGTCMNSPGSYECACDAGYDGTGTQSCTDINECTSLLPCDMLVVCENTPGSFQCGDCPEGYGGGGDACTDVDECDLNIDACGAGQCDNLAGGYECECPSGYSGSGTTSCLEIDECATDNGGCDELAGCTNTVGSFVCGSCPSGYSGSGNTTCVDIDECTTNNGGCDPIVMCRNTAGAYTCDPCPSGYTGNGYDGCVDIDECSLGEDTCTGNQHCDNVGGTYRCDGVLGLSAGSAHICAIFENGALKCWGSNGVGQLGYGDTIDRSAAQATAIALGAGRSAVAVATGQATTCALLDDATVKCWGDGQSNGSGSGSNVLAPPASPLYLGAGRTAKQVSVGTSHACVVLDDDTVKCWGGGVNGNGIGYPGNGGSSSPPSAVIDFGAGRTAKSVLALGGHTCVVMDDDGVKCWGYNPGGNLGLGDAVDRPLPSTAINFGVGRTVKKLAGSGVGYGATHLCAILDDDTLRCWGTNSSGQLGYGDTTNRNAPLSTPVNLGAGRHAVDVTVGEQHTCAVLDNATVKCWGTNYGGPLGYGDNVQRNAPVPETLNFGAGRSAVALAAGMRFTCAILDDSTVKCWGENRTGQLGYGMKFMRPTPGDTALDMGGGRTAVQVAAGTYHTCARLDDGSVKCWGSNSSGQLGYGDLIRRNDVPSATINFGVGRSAKFIAATDSHTCAILDDNTIRCWGYNGYGQFGYGNTTQLTAPSATAVNLGVGRTARALTLGTGHSCAILDDGTLRCWGTNSYGRLGYGDSTTRSAPISTPVNVGAGRTVTSVSASDLHTCAVLDDASVKCWGYNGWGQLGYGDLLQRTSPAPLPIVFAGGMTPARVSNGAVMSFATLTDGSLISWGLNEQGWLGYGDTEVRSSPPATRIFVGAGRTVLSIQSPRPFTGNAFHNCALLDDGSVKCWGSTNRFGELGTGDFVTRSAPPATAISFGEGRSAIDVATGGQHACAVLDDGTVNCWGDNEFGQLGDSYGLYWAPTEILVDLRGARP